MQKTDEKKRIEQENRLKDRMLKIKYKLIVISGKGGVGKTTVATNLAYAFMFLLALSVVFIIGNTLRLAIHNQYEEIQTLKLIGATDSFILRPFLYTGVFYGVAGVSLSMILVSIFMLNLHFASKQLVALYQIRDPFMGLSIKHCGQLLFISIFLGWLGAYLSTKGQLMLSKNY